MRLLIPFFLLLLFFSPQSSIALQVQFSESFDIDPAAPASWQSAQWDVSVHVRSRDHYYELEEVAADHGADCGPPPAVHMVSAYEDVVYSCKNHMMTTLNATGYGAIYLTPNHLIDFSAGEAVLQFDMSTFRKTGRDWVDIWITPFEDHLQLPLDNWLPDLQGLPREGIHVRMDLQRANSRFQAFLIENHEPIELTGTPEAYLGYESFLDQDQRRRDQFELRLSSTHLTFGMPAYNFYWYDEAIPMLAWDNAVVQLGHHSYNPSKDCEFDGSCGPNTWHWDNVIIEPAEPFLMIHAMERYTNAAESGVLTFENPSPANAHLRFAGIGLDVELSFDNGITWAPARRQVQKENFEEHFSSYFTPMPAGVEEVLIRATDWWGGPWHVRDASIWAQGDVNAVAIEEGETVVQAVVLGASFPNPVESQIRIPLQLSKQAHVRLEVVDLLGRTLHVLTDQVYIAGTHHVETDLTHLSAGMYLYRMTTSQHSEVRPFLLVR